MNTGTRVRLRVTALCRASESSESRASMYYSTAARMYENCAVRFHRYTGRNPPSIDTEGAHDGQTIRTSPFAFAYINLRPRRSLSDSNCRLRNWSPNNETINGIT